MSAEEKLADGVYLTDFRKSNSPSIPTSTTINSSTSTSSPAKSSPKSVPKKTSKGKGVSTLASSLSPSSKRKTGTSKTASAPPPLANSPPSSSKSKTVSAPPPTKSTTLKKTGLPPKPKVPEPSSASTSTNVVKSIPPEISAAAAKAEKTTSLSVATAVPAKPSASSSTVLLGGSVADNLAAINSEISELENSIRHLIRSNEELKAADANDPDFKEAIKENSSIITKKQQQVQKLKQSIISNHLKTPQKQPVSQSKRMSLPISSDIQFTKEGMRKSIANNQIGPPLDYSFLDINTWEELKTEEANSGFRKPRDDDPPLESKVINGKLVKEKRKVVKTTSIKMNNNSISSFEGFVDTMDYLLYSEDLSWIDLSFNCLKDIDSILLNYPKLTALYLHANQISDLSQVDKLIKLPSLRSLTLHGNPIENRNQKAYRHYIISLLPNLKSLDFSAITPQDRDEANTWRKLHAPKKGPKNLLATLVTTSSTPSLNHRKRVK